MRTRTTPQTSTGRRERRDSHPTPRQVVASRGEQRTRDAGGPQDSATYACECGHVFAEDVSTHVDCPRCGAGQAW